MDTKRRVWVRWLERLRAHVPSAATAVIAFALFWVADFWLAPLLPAGWWQVVFYLLGMIVVVALLRLVGESLSGKWAQWQGDRVIKRSLHTVITKMGIEDGTTLGAPDSGPLWSTSRCMRDTKHVLKFSGVAGQKWVLDPETRQSFDKFLHRLDAQCGEVHFLLLDPKSRHYKSLQKVNENLGTQSFVILSRLMNEHPCLKVKLYRGPACFRLVFIDSRILAASFYVINDGQFATRSGLEAPHMVVNPQAEYPLYGAFATLFESIWNHGSRYLPLDYMGEGENP